jgi:hypothetical protein
LSEKRDFRIPIQAATAEAFDFRPGARAAHPKAV